jgi:hypothetical protein
MSVDDLTSSAAKPLVSVVMPVLNEERFGAEHEKRRKEFYRRDDVRNVPLEWMVQIYSGLAADNGFEIIWWFSRNRDLCYRLRPRLKCRLCYLMLSLHRKANDSSRSSRWDQSPDSARPTDPPRAEWQVQGCGFVACA